MSAQVVEQALAWLEGQMCQGDAMSSPEVVKRYLRLRLGGRPHEVFALVYLDSRHRVIEVQELFRGTLTQTAVYPREVVIEALQRNAAAVILAHNHPGGSPEPSQADRHLTRQLKQVLDLVDVRVLDHLVITREAVVSLAERGWV